MFNGLFHPKLSRKCISGSLPLNQVFQNLNSICLNASFLIKGFYPAPDHWGCNCCMQYLPIYQLCKFVCILKHPSHCKNMLSLNRLLKYADQLTTSQWTGCTTIRLYFLGIVLHDRCKASLSHLKFPFFTITTHYNTVDGSLDKSWHGNNT